MRKARVTVENGVREIGTGVGLILNLGRGNLFKLWEGKFRCNCISRGSLREGRKLKKIRTNHQFFWMSREKVLL